MLQQRDIKSAWVQTEYKPALACSDVSSDVSQSRPLQLGWVKCVWGWGQMMLGLCCRADRALLSLHLTNNNKITSLPHRSKPAFTPFSWVPLICPLVNYIWILSQMKLIKQTLLYTFHKEEEKKRKKKKKPWSWKLLGQAKRSEWNGSQMYMKYEEKKTF